jgi:hypothetical protein
VFPSDLAVISAEDMLLLRLIIAVKKMLSVMLMVTIKVKLPVMLIAAVILTVVLILSVAATVLLDLPRSPISICTPLPISTELLTIPFLRNYSLLSRWKRCRRSLKLSRHRYGILLYPLSRIHAA